MLNTPSQGRTIELSGDETVVIGAEEACHLVIEDPTVSRQHAKVSRTDEGALIVDLDSTNGTYYERSRVREVVVPFGATIALGKALVKVLPQENEVKTAPSKAERFGALVGQDRRMREMFSLLADVAPTEATVVIEGETGTGKELVASALHEHSPRARKPFVVFDCSAVPHDLVESALFGHVKGAFTGATATRQGAFRRAHGGTIFLDEIGELPLDLQPKLLRAIESRTVQAVGGDDYERVDVRVIAATNRNLKAEVRAGRFREDLYYRLAVVRIVLPPLRERLDDLQILVQHFLKAGENGGPPVEIDPRCWDALRSYSWPGNVRELKNLVERGRSLFRGPGMLDLSRYLPGAGELSGLASEEITERAPAPAAADAPSDVVNAVMSALDHDAGLSFKDAKNLVIGAFERHYLEGLLEESKGNISRAAQAAKMDRKHLQAPSGAHEEVRALGRERGVADGPDRQRGSGSPSSPRSGRYPWPRAAALPSSASSFSPLDAALADGAADASALDADPLVDAAPGGAGEGQLCEFNPGDCAAGLVCVPAPFSDVYGLCRVDRALRNEVGDIVGKDPEACPDGRTCQILVDPQSLLVEMVACELPQSFRDGVCQAPGDPDACADEMRCHVAYLDPDGLEPAAFRCKTTCDKDAPKGAQGCPAGELCFASSIAQDVQRDELKNPVFCEFAACETGGPGCACHVDAGYECVQLETSLPGRGTCALLPGLCGTPQRGMTSADIVDGQITTVDVLCKEVDDHLSCDNRGFEEVGSQGQNLCLFQSQLGIPYYGLWLPFCSAPSVDGKGDGFLDDTEMGASFACPVGERCYRDLGRALLLGFGPQDPAGPYGIRACNPAACTDGQPCPSECGPGDTECVTFNDSTLGPTSLCLGLFGSCEPARPGDEEAGVPAADASVEAPDDGGVSTEDAGGAKADAGSPGGGGPGFFDEDRPAVSRPGCACQGARGGAEAPLALAFFLLVGLLPPLARGLRRARR